MSTSPSITKRKLRVFTDRHLSAIPQIAKLKPERREAMRAVSAVLPFRVNEYVVDELIDWSRVPDDPMFQLTFPQPGMIEAGDLERMRALVRRGASAKELRAAARPIQARLNPHPAGQQEMNVPHVDGEPLPGMQHKYRETVLFFPTQGQTCHAYCTYCFRWAQFVGLSELKFAAKEVDLLRRYLEEHTEVRSVLFTGGDPMVMKASVFRRYVEPLLSLPHIQSIRVGTKSVAYWPQRFVTDDDADEMLRLFEDVVRAGKSLALMGHYSHPRELSTPVAERAVERIRGTGAVVRSQAPLIRHVNDDADAWASMWNRQVRMGIVPYYLFVERDTGARGYFEVPLAEALAIFRDARGQLSGLGRTVRGPSMSTTPGKILVDGIARVGGQEVFVLKFLQARDPRWVDEIFFARFDPDATWLNQLEPAFGRDEFFFERGLREIRSAARKHERKRLRVVPRARAEDAPAG